MPTANEPVRLVVLSPHLDFVESSAVHLGNNTREKAVSLARALACSPIWNIMGPGHLVLRPDPVPVLAALGRFDAADVARLEFLARWLEPAVTSLRYIGYPEVTDAVVRLANELHDLFGPEVRDFDFVGIPRGGLIVYGMLAYALNLEVDSSPLSSDPNRPLIVVDDCALTGNRLARFMAGVDRRSVTFVHLCSPPQLRAAMVEKEPMLTHALASFDLPDLAPERMGDDYEQWHAQAAVRAGDDRYWIGQTETVVFPWNEPDQNFWNPESGETEWGWRITPPEQCLKNSIPHGSVGVPVQVQQKALGPYAPADHLLWAPFEEAVVVLDLVTGSTLRLDGVAGVIWNGIMDGEPMGQVAERIASTYAVEEDMARTDADAFINELLARGILTSRGPAPS